MKLEIALLIASLFLTTSVIAKEKARNNTENGATEKEYREFKNSVCVIGTLYYFPKIGGPFIKTISPDGLFNHLTNSIADQLGLYFERKIYKNFRMGVGYLKWNTFFLRGLTGTDFISGGNYDTTRRGTIISRYEYSMADLVFIYRYNKFKKHKIDVSIGPSYTYGMNDVYDTLYYGHIAVSHQEHADYYGFTAGIGYDFLCLNNRVALGYNFRWRKYINMFGSQIDYGIHIKFNF